MTHVDTALGLEANQGTTYTKTAVYNDISTFAKKTTCVDTRLVLKANQATTYTRSKVYNALALKRP